MNVSRLRCSTALDSRQPIYQTKVTPARLDESKQAVAVVSSEISLLLAAAAASVQKNLRVGWIAKQLCSVLFPHSKTSNTGKRLNSACAQPKVSITLSEKVLYLRLKNFSLDTCVVENDTFSEFIDLLYDYQDIFAYSATDIPKCNLLKCHLSTYPDAKPTRCRPYRLSDEIRL